MKIPIIIPTNCPTCNSDLIRNGPFLECSNKNCPEVKVHQIMKWIQKQNIMHLARKTLDKLIEYKLVNCIADLYTLKLEQVQHIDGIGQGFQRIIDEIDKSRNPTLAKYLSGFDMDGLGERVWQFVIDKLGLSTLENVFSLEYDELLSVDGIGPERAMAILNNLAELGSELIVTSRVVGISTVVKTRIIDGSLANLSFCFTGALKTMKRTEAEKLVTDNGGSISSVSKNLNYLVTNDKDSGSSKNEKAAKLGIKLINEEEFLAMI